MSRPSCSGAAGAAEPSGEGGRNTIIQTRSEDSSSGDVSASFATSGGLTPPSFSATEPKARRSPEPALTCISSTEQQLVPKSTSNVNVVCEPKSAKVQDDKVNDDNKPTEEIKSLDQSELSHAKSMTRRESEMVSRTDSTKLSDHVPGSSNVKSSTSDYQMGYGPGVSATDVAAALLGVSTSSQSITNNNLQQFRSSNRDQMHSRYRRGIAGHVDEDDLSTPYNHYRCLSPSEQHLNHIHHNNHYIKPHHGTGSGVSSNRFLKRQFSLDRGDDPSMSILCNTSSVSTMTLDSATYVGTPRAASTGRLFKQNSAGAAHDLERIEEIPLSNTGGSASPRMGGHRNTINSNYFRNKCELPPFSSSSMSVSVESLN